MAFLRHLVSCGKILSLPGPLEQGKGFRLGFVLAKFIRCKQFEKTEFAALAGIYSRNPKRFATKLPHPAAVVNPPIWQATQRQLALHFENCQHLVCKNPTLGRDICILSPSERLWLPGHALHFTIQSIYVLSLCWSMELATVCCKQWETNLSTSLSRPYQGRFCKVLCLVFVSRAMHCWPHVPPLST